MEVLQDVLEIQLLLKQLVSVATSLYAYSILSPIILSIMSRILIYQHINSSLFSAYNMLILETLVFYHQHFVSSQPDIRTMNY